MSGKYEDIIGLSRPVSLKHMPMSNYDRAAQFAPFAALTGYDGVIAETARLTEYQAELDVGAVAELNEMLRRVWEDISTHPKITVTYFKPDSRKSGGAYVTMTGRVKKIDSDFQLLTFLDGTAIPLGNIHQIE